MRRVALFCLALVLAMGGLAAGQPTEDYCLLTVGGAAAGSCDVEGAAFDIGFEAFEPTMGSDDEGNLYFATTPALGLALGWEASIGASFDGGRTWSDIRPNAGGVNTPPETNDPYTYVDPGTGRVFAFHMAPILTCSILSWSDDRGATWETNPLGCAPTGAWDHQTMVAAVPTDGVTTVGYPNVLVQCVNAIYAAECGRSLDGGRTWLHTVPVHVNSQAGTLCGAQHGHLAADQEGTIYLPTSECGTAAIVYVSRDSGLTWTRQVIDPSPIPFEDPAIAVDAAGTVHAVWADASGAMLFSRSHDGAVTWTDPIRVTPPNVTGKLPTIVAGDQGRIAFAFIGSDDYPEGGYTWQDTDPDQDFEPTEVEFGGWITYSLDADAEAPTFTSVEATGSDPLLRGDVCTMTDRCASIVDFIGSTVTPDGRVFGAVIDSCFEECTVDTGMDKAGRGVGAVITIPGLDLCEGTCPRFPDGSGQAIDGRGSSAATVPSTFGRLAGDWRPATAVEARDVDAADPAELAERAEWRRAYNVERDLLFAR